MAQYATIAQMNGLYKEAYAAGIVGLIPDIAYLVKNIEFGEAERVGNYYHQPVILARETGVSYGAAGDGAYALAPSVAMTMKDAQIQGAQITLRSSIPYDTVARSLGSAKAFRKATLPIIESNLESHTKRLELALLYGKSATGLGQIKATGISGTGTTRVVTISDATWAVGIWGGEEGAKVVIYNGTSTARVSSAADAVYTIAAVDPDNKQLTLTCTTTGGTDLDTAVGSYACNIYWYGTTGLSSGTIAATWTVTNSVEMYGIDKILTNTGTLFGVSASDFTLWAGNAYACASSQFTMAKALAATAKAVGKGGLKEKVVCLCSHTTWNNLMTDQAALRKYDDSYSSGDAENGMETIKYHGASGEIEVVAHTAVKEGEAFILPLKRWARVGATEVTFQTPGRPDEMFLQIPDYNAFELRSYSDQATFCRTPAKCVKISGIVNT